MKVIKKDGTTENFERSKIVSAVTKSANRVMVDITDEQFDEIVSAVEKKLRARNADMVEVSDMHNVVEQVLEDFDPKIAKSYKDYRNYKKDFVHLMDEVYQASQSIRFIGDKENSNSDSALVATKRCLIFNELNKRLYRKFFMTNEELQACKDGYIYIHDQSARLDTINCCLCDVASIMKGGFEMGNVWYNEPKTLDTAFDVIGDIIISTASQQYGGFTVPEVDKILSPYAEKSYKKYYDEYVQIMSGVHVGEEAAKANAHDYAMSKVQRDFEQGFQGIEMKLNTVGSSRGDYPFVTMTFGLATDRFGRMASKTFLKVHQNGQGKAGNKKPVLFPKLVFLYDKNIHGEGCINEDVFEAGIQCSAKTMYPDWLSLTGEGYISEMYKKYGRVVSPMGCVDGDEVVTYKIGDDLYVESFKRMWNRITATHKDVGQRSLDDENRVVNLKNSNVSIYDTKQAGFTKVNCLIRNVQDNWCDVTISNGRKLRVTTDHPFETNRGVVLAKDLTEEDVIPINIWQYSEGRIEHFDDDAWKLGTTMYSDSMPSDAFVCIEKSKYGFLAGIIDANGKIEPGKHHMNGSVKVTSANKELAIQEMLLAQSLGMNAGIYDDFCAELSTGETVYTVEICPNRILIDTMRRGDLKDEITELNLLEIGKGIINHGNVVSVDPVEINQYSYDVSTESEHFEVSGVYSHNCRAFLAPWYERGGVTPADEDDKPVFVGRFNIGAVSLHLPMILAKSRQENRDFYEVLDYYLEMIRGIHKRTYEYLGEMRASINPVQFCEGGLYGGHLKPSDKLKSILKPMTASFGITALNELQELYNHKSIAKDGEFALEVMRHINKKVAEFKAEDGWLYAIYSTPAENLCGLQIEQFRQMYGVIENVSDRPYVSNSFHCHVTEDITPIEKQDLEGRFWDLSNGGKIQYVRYPISYNIDAVRTLVLRAMEKGYYEGVNLSLAYCDDCGHQELEMDVCPKCGSKNLTKIDRMNGYLSYSRVHGDTRLNDAKMAEIAERVSM